MSKCVNCGGNLPPLNGCEENDFRSECEHCEIESELFDEEEDEYHQGPVCEHCHGDHSSYLCTFVTRFDDMDCLKCGETFFLRNGSCSKCGFQQY